MTNFYAPGLHLMQHTRIRTKVGLMATILLIPLFMFMVTVAKTAYDDLTFTQRELSGAKLIQPISAVLLQLQTHRDLAVAAMGGDEVLRQEKDKARVQLKERIETLNNELEHHKGERVYNLFTPIQSRMREIASGQVASDRAAIWAQYAEPIQALRQALLAVAEESGLALDPEAKTYYLMDLGVERIMSWAEAATRLRSSGSDVARENHANVEHNTLLRNQVETLNSQLLDVQLRIEALIRAGHDTPATWDSTRAVSSKLSTAALDLASRDNSGITPQALVALVDDAQGSINRMAHEVHSELTRLLQQRLQTQWLTLAAKAALCLFGLILVAYLSSCFYTDFFSKIQAVQSALSAVSNGNLSKRLNLSGNDELVDVGHQIDVMSERLSLLVSEVRSSAVRVGQAGLSVSADGRALSQQTEEQAANLRQSVTTVEELSSAVSSNAEAAVALEHMTGSLRTQAEAGSTAMDETVQSIHSLQESARRIGEINNVINDIAFQTNLLALNASVEAARAGESGRGFAVVASEVRQLAQRCADAASEVHDVIEQTTDLVDISVNRISSVSGTLGAVVRGVGEVSIKLKSIAAASEQQSMGLQAVSATVGSLDDLTHLNANLVDRSAQSSKALVAQAEALRHSVAHIQLRQGTADEAQALVERAVARISEVGWSRAAIEFNNPHGNFVDRDLYLFGLNREGVYVVMGTHPQWVGRNIDDIAAIPSHVAHEFMQLANERASFGRGWVEYDGPSEQNPTGLRKTAYIVAIDDDTFLGCGVLRQAITVG